MTSFLDVFLTCLDADGGKRSCKRGCSLRLARNGRSGLSLCRNVEGGCNTCVLGSYNIHLRPDVTENGVGGVFWDVTSVLWVRLCGNGRGGGCWCSVVVIGDIGLVATM